MWSLKSVKNISYILVNNISKKKKLNQNNYIECFNVFDKILYIFKEIYKLISKNETPLSTLNFDHIFHWFQMCRFSTFRLQWTSETCERPQRGNKSTWRKLYTTTSDSRISEWVLPVFVGPLEFIHITCQNIVVSLSIT